MDVLADVFEATRIGGLVYANTVLRGAWSLQFDRSDKVGFHVVVEGSACLRSKGALVPLGPGDIVLLPRGFTHVLADTPKRKAIPWSETLASQAAAPPPGAATRLMCGAYAFDEVLAGPLLSLLPPVVHVPAGHPDIAAVVGLLDGEARRGAPGSAAIMVRLVDTLFLYALRSWVNASDLTATWLHALGDARIGRALALLHGAVARGWTLEALAREVGMSRAAFARRFGERVGQPPLEYLTQWRMTLAGRALRDSGRTLAEIAADVGYASEFAFSKAFKRVNGLAPDHYRRRAR